MLLAKTKIYAFSNPAIAPCVYPRPCLKVKYVIKCRKRVRENVFILENSLKQMCSVYLQSTYPEMYRKWQTHHKQLTRTIYLLHSPYSNILYINTSPQITCASWCHYSHNFLSILTFLELSLLFEPQDLVEMEEVQMMQN